MDEATFGGWLIDAMFVGKGSFAETHLGSEIFGIVKKQQQDAFW
jgi:hypothetical protein